MSSLSNSLTRRHAKAADETTNEGEKLMTTPVNDLQIRKYSKAAYNHLVEAQHEMNQAMAAFADMLDRFNALGITYEDSDDAQQIAQLVDGIAPNLRKATELVAAAPRTTQS